MRLVYGIKHSFALQSNAHSCLIRGFINNTIIYRVYGDNIVNHYVLHVLT